MNGKADQKTKRAAERVARKMVAQEAMRSFRSGDQVFVLDFELKQDPDLGPLLVCTTWGHDHEWLPLPKTYRDMVNLKMRAQLDILTATIPQAVAVRFYMAIMREVNP